jgi:hypothetical protein
MLCIHMLGEVEGLIDTVGSPGALSARFSTELKIDIGLMDESWMIKMDADRWISQ